jgi:proprotein convertase subtilisin/kexin type 5
VNNTCNPCPFPCTSCSTPTICFTCFVSYYYYNFGCTLTCPNITFPNNTLCSPCSPSCLTCMLAHSTCTSCQPSLNFFNNTCMLGCPPGTYNASGACAACSSLCNTCSNFSVCTGCTGPLFLTNSQCLTSCPPGTFANTASNTCNGCTQNCATC